MIQTTFWVLRRIDTEDWMALTIEYTANFALWTCSSLLIHNRLSSHWLREPLITTQPCFPRPNYCCLQLSVIWPGSPWWASQMPTRNFILVPSKMFWGSCTNYWDRGGSLLLPLIVPTAALVFSARNEDVFEDRGHKWRGGERRS